MSAQSNNRILIYDDYCPMCNLYTKAFVKTNFIDSRLNFSTISPEMEKMIDINKARHEIPYIDIEKGTVFYGIDALAEIIGSKIPFSKKIIYWTPIYWFLRKLYKLISYNRHIIVPHKRDLKKFDCRPDLNITYRIAYILIAFLFSTLLTNWFMSSFLIYQSPTQYFLSGAIAGSKWGLQLVIGFIFLKSKKWDYLGQLATTCLIGSLLLMPFAILGSGEKFFISSLVISVIVMLWDIFRRFNIIGISKKWSFLWLFFLIIAVSLQLTIVFDVVHI